MSTFVANDGGLRGARTESDLNRLVASQALVLSFADTSRAVAIISLCLAPLALILKRPQLAPPMPAGK